VVTVGFSARSKSTSGVYASRDRVTKIPRFQAVVMMVAEEVVVELMTGLEDGGRLMPSVCICAAIYSQTRPTRLRV
jgi:hypothetical protein